MASNADTYVIVEIAVAETMNQLEHDYGVEGLEDLGLPTIQEIRDVILKRHFAYAIKDVV